MVENSDCYKALNPIPIRHSPGCRLESQRSAAEEQAHKLAARFAELKKAAAEANAGKERAWERAKAAGTAGDRWVPRF